MDKSKDVFLISKEEDFDLICSPVRASVLEILIAFGPMPVREIAARLGRSATLIHHHVGILYRGGLLREHALEKRGKHVERIYAMTTEDWRFDLETHPEAMVAGLIRISRTWGRHAERLLSKTLKKNRKISPIMQRFLTARAETGYLSEQAAQSVKEHLSSIRRIFEQERRREGGSPFHIFWNYFPMAQDATKGKGSDRPVSPSIPKVKAAKSKPKSAKANKKVTKSDRAR